MKALLIKWLVKKYGVEDIIRFCFENHYSKQINKINIGGIKYHIHRNPVKKQVTHDEKA